MSNAPATAAIPTAAPRRLSAGALPTLLLAALALLLPAVLPAGSARAGEGSGAGEATWEAPGAHPEIPTDRPLRVAFLVVDGVYNTELMAPYDIFHHTPFHTGPLPGMEVFTVSPDGEPVTSFEGLVLHPHHSFRTAPAADVLVVPSSEHSMGSDLDDRELISWVRKASERARWVVSLCDGAFVLAEAGLLDGRAATTFPSDYDAFAARFPQVDLRVNLSFVHDGPALTSQGGVMSYDVALYLVDLLYGEEVARGVGAGLLIPWPIERRKVPGYAVIASPAGGEGAGDGSAGDGSDGDDEEPGGGTGSGGAG